jgi:hypothetical protein
MGFPVISAARPSRLSLAGLDATKIHNASPASGVIAAANKQARVSFNAVRHGISQSKNDN